MATVDVVDDEQPARIGGQPRNRCRNLDFLLRSLSLRKSEARMIEVMRLEPGANGDGA